MRPRLRRIYSLAADPAAALSSWRRSAASLSSTEAWEQNPVPTA
jgi:hypothetical protein